MEFGLSFNEIQDVHNLPRWDTGQRFIVQITIPDGYLLFQVSLYFSLFFDVACNGVLQWPTSHQPSLLNAGLKGSVLFVFLF